MSGYRIDLAIVHPDDSSRYIVGIECDGAMYHSSANDKEREYTGRDSLTAGVGILNGSGVKTGG
jgi:hypothetical protein